MVASFGTRSCMKVIGENSTKILEPNYLYEAVSSKNEEDYLITDESLVSKMSFGRKTIGKLKISGDINKEFPADDEYFYLAGVKDGQLSFSYQYSTDFFDNKSDCCVTFSLLMIQKESDGEWVDVVTPVTGFLEDNHGNAENFYTTNGNDLSNGCLYCITLMYDTKEKRESDGFLSGLFPKYDYYQHEEDYYFYACMNNGAISIHDLSAKKNDFSEINGYSVEAVSKAETLQSGDTTIGGFSIEQMNLCDFVTVNSKETKSGTKFTKNGKYVVQLHYLGGIVNHVIYIFDGGEDCGKSEYFGDYLVDGQRMYWDGEYPMYTVGAKARINQVDSSVPALTGTLKNLTTNAVVLDLDGKSRSEVICELQAGEYLGEFYSGHTDSGSYYHYTFHFFVSEDSSIPHINYDTLLSETRLSDYMSKHYEVTIPTTRGGNIYVCFADYDEAFAFAYETEKRYVEQNEDGLYYKTSFSNPQKIKYLFETDEDKMQLTELLSSNAEKSVEIAYFNPKEKMSIQEMDEKEIQQEMESLTLAESKHVTLPESRDNLLKRVPYINDFQFMYVGDYESQTITALCRENDKVYSLEFGKPVNEQLDVSSRYTITEKNEYGVETTYDVNYMSENQTTSIFQIKQGEDSLRREIQQVEEVTADSVKIIKSYNLLDEYAIVTIKAPRIYKKELTCLVTELNNLLLYKAGDYELVFSDRVGNSYTVKLHLNGDTSAKFSSASDKSYSDIYNSIHLNDTITEE